MSSHKSEEFKKFAISTRKKIGPGVSNAPVWVFQKAGKRIWNSKQKRKWSDVDMGDLFKKSELKKKQAKRRKKF